ncbi:MAG: hypothetical protein RLZZ453_323 [Chlamydiota bacterium]|jgi:hypothetical protein
MNIFLNTVLPVLEFIPDIGGVVVSASKVSKSGTHVINSAQSLMPYKNTALAAKCISSTESSLNLLTAHTHGLSCVTHLLRKAFHVNVSLPAFISTMIPFLGLGVLSLETLEILRKIGHCIHLGIRYPQNERQCVKEQLHALEWNYFHVHPKILQSLVKRASKRYPSAPSEQAAYFIALKAEELRFQRKTLCSSLGNTLTTLLDVKLPVLLKQLESKNFKQKQQAEKEALTLIDRIHCQLVKRGILHTIRLIATILAIVALVLFSFYSFGLIPLALSIVSTALFGVRFFMKKAWMESKGWAPNLSLVWRGPKKHPLLTSFAFVEDVREALDAVQRVAE